MPSNGNNKETGAKKTGLQHSMISSANKICALAGE